MGHYYYYYYLFINNDIGNSEVQEHSKLVIFSTAYGMLLPYIHPHY
jgi:hypothetical protein